MAETKKKRGRPPLTPEEKEQRAIEKRERAAEWSRGENYVERQTLAAKRGAPLAFGNEKLPSPGDNSKFLRHALTTMGMPPIDISDPVQVEERIWWYFGHCIENDMKPTVIGMCNSLGIHRDTIHTWKTGEQRKGTHQEIIVRAYRVLEELWEDYMLNGKVNPVSGIFLGKVHFGYREQQELILTPNQQQFTPEDVTTIEAKYAELPDDEE